MDTSEPSTNGTSATNLFRLSSLLSDDSYAQKAKETLDAFEAEAMQYPWLFGSFMPGIVATRLGVQNRTILEAADAPEEADVGGLNEYPRGTLSTLAKVTEAGSTWLRSRNTLLKNVTFPSSGGRKVMICANGACTEFVEGIDTTQEGDADVSNLGVKSDSVPVDEAAALAAAQAETLEEAVQKAREAVEKLDVADKGKEDMSGAS